MGNDSHDADKDPRAPASEIETKPTPESAQAQPHEVANLVKRNIALRSHGVEMAKAKADQERSDFLTANAENTDKQAHKAVNNVTAVLIVVCILVVTGVIVGGILYYLIQTGQF